MSRPCLGCGRVIDTGRVCEDCVQFAGAYREIEQLERKLAAWRKTVAAAVEQLKAVGRDDPDYRVYARQTEMFAASIPPSLLPGGEK